MRIETQPLTSFTWNDEKRLANISKHGIDFEDAAVALQRPRVERPSDRNGEVRVLAICPDTNHLIAVVYTMRGSICRIISARRARKNEQALYDTYHNR
ncbi:BrnT family toxin [Rhizobium sp. C4]|uniref:BrnT family toxin n=1 Tax=Rhizobium sp. C4 TaxID=1349800 RepID=UPI001E57DE5B|nr:BrnT family toxin [Rhizobium sp. C4]MCD2175928.1 BrnT family toxin [Rhizobium sp. C4]